MEHPPANDVLVIVSAIAEWRAIERLFPGAAMRRSPYGAWFRAEVGAGARPVLLMHGGWGKIAAAASAQYALACCVPSLAVNLGTCGGFRGCVDAGAIILVERTVVYDIDEQMGDQAEHLAHYATTLDLAWLGSRTPHPVVRATMVSGDRDLRPADIPRLRRDFGAIAGDWESASIAWVAARQGVRTLILRGVSDLIDETGGEAYDGNAHVFEQNTQIIMQRLIAQLPDWLKAAEIA